MLSKVTMKSIAEPCSYKVSTLATCQGKGSLNEKEIARWCCAHLIWLENSFQLSISYVFLTFCSRAIGEVSQIGQCSTAFETERRRAVDIHELWACLLQKNHAGAQGDRSDCGKSRSKILQGTRMLIKTPLRSRQGHPVLPSKRSKCKRYAILRTFLSGDGTTRPCCRGSSIERDRSQTCLCLNCTEKVIPSQVAVAVYITNLPKCLSRSVVEL